MYICLCNAMTDADIRRAIANGARRPREVYEAAGCQAQCGGCTPTILDLLRGSSSSGWPQGAVAAAE
ncbi:MAG: bacterioferritin-associated ferredoxin [Acetobacteraceae bacterium]